MEALGDLSPDAESEKAAKFYEQALLLVDCCRIPEAIRLLEQAIKIKPDSEIFKESLAILQMNYFPAEQQGESYASVARPQPNQDNGKENVSSYEWKTRKTRVRENSNKAGSPSTLSSDFQDDTHRQSSIENPWASFMKRGTSRRKKAQGSPIDGISEIEIPPVNDGFHAGSPMCCKGCIQDYQDKGDIPVLSDSEQKKAGRPVVDAQGDCLHGSAYISKKDNFPENKIANGNGNLDTKFMEEFCLARESGTDDWDKYYEVLCSGMRETCSESDVLFQNTNKSHECSDTLDEIKVAESVTNCTGKDLLTERSDFSSSNVCSKCGHPKGNGNRTLSPTKNRIHFVNGVCLSSPSGLTCTCNKQEKDVSESQSAKTPLSSSQQEFYRNLRQYFGRSKVNNVKTGKEAENDVKSSESHQKSSSACSFDGHVSSATFKNDKPLNAQPNMNVSETTQHSESQNERRNSKEHVKHKATDNHYTGSDCRRPKPSFDSSQVKADKKLSDKEKFQPVDKQKSRRHNKVQSKTKEPIRTGHVKDKREGVSHSDGSQRGKSRVKDCNKSKGSQKKGADDTYRPAAASATKDTGKPSQRQKEESTADAESQSDCTALVVTVYDTGKKVASACLQVSKSIMYYIILLAALLLTFLLYCVWLATSWLVRKVLHFFAVERLFGAVKSRISSLYEWLRKSRGTPQKTAQQGQTYDLPKNGDAAIRHMLENRDSDPYSVLGVPSDASDDDIRRQYRKLAVLIHPDKNMDSQADEAFKILANAFDVLSDADKRRDYDTEMAWKRSWEEREERFGRPNSPEQFFADLGRKMQEMQNYLHCNQCDGKHRRYSTDRFVLTARYCSRCNTRHAAKEGDLWAESSFLGYKIHFYACMEGEIYDVTEWASCQGIGNYRVDANPHTVHLKLKTRQPNPSGFNSRTEEEDFENFMRAFFGQFNPPREERHHGSNKQPKKRKRKKR